MSCESGKKSMSCRIPMAVLWTVFVVCAGTTLLRHAPPAVIPANGPAEEFSADRAMEHIRAIAAKPHMAGTAANAEVREYIQSKLEDLGITHEIQECTINPRPGLVATVQNVLGRIHGTNSEKAVLFAAHYDSVSFGPGAADDGAGVATLLETVRALKSGKALQNDVIFLFTDGEEGFFHGGYGILGARAFAKEHRWARDVAVVLNFDCRGNRGPSYMYEISQGNGWLIAQLARAHCHPITTSFMADVYNSMPLGSDFTAFKMAGMAGMNFAFIDGLEKYHTARDTVENLNVRSLQHHGVYALRLARLLGNQPLDQVTQPDRTYFNVFGSWLIHYPVAWAGWINASALVLFVVMLIVAWWSGKVTARSLVYGLVFFTLCAVTLTAIAAGLAIAGYRLRGPYILYSSGVLTIAFLLFAAGAYLLVARRMLSRNGVFSVAAGAAFWWAVLTVASAWALPGASYVFAWPLLFQSAGMILLAFLPQEGAEQRWGAAILTVCGLPGVLLLTPILYGLHGAVTVIFCPVIVFLGVLLLGLLTPQVGLLLRHTGRWMAFAGWAVGACFLAMGILWPGFSPEQPKMSALTYGLDAASGQAYWMSSDATLDEWSRLYFPEGSGKAIPSEFLPGLQEAYWRAKAPVAALEPPLLECVSDIRNGDVREVVLRISSPRKACRMTLNADPLSTVHDATLNGRKLKPVDGSWYLQYSILPRDYFDLTLKIPADVPLRLTAVDYSPDLPEMVGASMPARPEYMIPKPNTVDFNRCPLKSDACFVSKTYAF